MDGRQGMLVEMGVDGSHQAIIVEVEDIYQDDLVLASPEAGLAQKVSQTLTDALKDLTPALATLRDRLIQTSPDSMQVKFGIKLGGETGIIVAKGTAEANFEVTMTWQRASTA